MRWQQEVDSDNREAQVIAEEWASHWNAHDIEALLTHFSDDVVFSSPMASQLLGGWKSAARREVRKRLREKEASEVTLVYPQFVIPRGSEFNLELECP